MDFAKYLGRKVVWYVIALFVALLLNFLLPRLIPGNPVDSIVSQMTRGGGASGEQMKAIYAHYMQQFGLDKPMWQQFLVYLDQLVHGNLGTSFSQYPASVNSLVGKALPWSIVIQLPAILVGWLVGNLLGAIAAYKGGWFDRGAFVASLFASSMPYYCLAILLLFFVGVKLGILPVGGAYSLGLSPELTPAFFGDAITSYDWAYVIAPDRVGTLFTLLGGHAGDDLPGLLAVYHDQHGGQMNDLLRGPQVAAAFSNWHS